MHRIDGPGFAPGNLWTEGNPTLGVPATTVTDDFQNDIQEEVANTIEDAGIVLVKGNQVQLRDAIILMIGGASAGAGIQQSILNNQAAPTAIVGLVFDKATVKAGSFLFDIERQTDSSNVLETGHGFVTFDPVADNWRVAIASSFDSAGVTFIITASGQIQYTSDDLTGTSYAGEIRIIDIKRILDTIP